MWDTLTLTELNRLTAKILRATADTLNEACQLVRVRKDVRDYLYGPDVYEHARDTAAELAHLTLELARAMEQASQVLAS